LLFEEGAVVLRWPVSRLLTTSDPVCPRSWDFATPNQISAASRAGTGRTATASCVAEGRGLDFSPSLYSGTL